MQQVTLIVLRNLSRILKFPPRSSIVTSGVFRVRSKTVLFDVLSARDAKRLACQKFPFVLSCAFSTSGFPCRQYSKGNTKRSRRTHAKRQVIPGVINKVSVSMKTLVCDSFEKFSFTISVRLSSVNIPIPYYPPFNLWNPSYFSLPTPITRRESSPPLPNYCCCSIHICTAYRTQCIKNNF